MKLIKIGLLLLLFPLSKESKNIEIQYLANEGIRITGGQREVFIDALFSQEFEHLDALPKDISGQFIGPNKEMDDVILLATHFHGDHFSKELTGNFMMNHKNSVFIAPSETVNKLKSFDGYKAIEQRMRPSTPVLHKSERIEVPGIRITSLRLNHMGFSPWKEAENIGFLVELNGIKILHLGDSKVDKTNLEPFHLNDLEIDIAIIPYWEAVSTSQRILIEQYIDPEEIFIGHIPIKDYNSAQKSIDSLGYKNATALVEPMRYYAFKKE